MLANRYRIGRESLAIPLHVVDVLLEPTDLGVDGCDGGLRMLDFGSQVATRLAEGGQGVVVQSSGGGRALLPRRFNGEFGLDSERLASDSAENRPHMAGRYVRCGRREQT